MSKVWYAVPSARPIEEAEPILAKWRDQGYRLMLFRNEPETISQLERESAMAVRLKARCWFQAYPGYALAVNWMVKSILNLSPDAEWIVTGGDDVEPDPNKRADEISTECVEHFFPGGLDVDPTSREREIYAKQATFGVMQPTGDPWRDIQGRIIERIAGSPWMGREFCRRMYQGNGPLWPEYQHMFVDEEAQCVAQKLGVFWQRPDLTHLHHHWQREGSGATAVPDHLKEACSRAHWDKYKAIFERRKVQGFPGHEPIL